MQAAAHRTVPPPPPFPPLPPPPAAAATLSLFVKRNLRLGSCSALHKSHWREVYGRQMLKKMRGIHPPSLPRPPLALPSSFAHGRDSAVTEEGDPVVTSPAPSPTCCRGNGRVEKKGRKSCRQRRRRVTTPTVRGERTVESVFLCLIVCVCVADAHTQITHRTLLLRVGKPGRTRSHASRSEATERADPPRHNAALCAHASWLTGSTRSDRRRGRKHMTGELGSTCQREATEQQSTSCEE